VTPSSEVRRIAPAGEERRTAGTSRSRILFADDDDWLCALAVRRLTRDGYRVFEACSGDEALLMLAAMRERGWPSDGIELVMLDAHMPGCDGVDVLRRLRDDRFSVPVIVMAFPEPGLYRDLDALHAYVLVKPFSLEDMVHVIAAVLHVAVVRGMP
jgi:DNA-binding response OmpR family regulator